jgi:putative cell wall-binding protein
VVADALSQKVYNNMLEIQEQQPELYEEFAKLNLGFVSNTEAVAMEVESTLEQEF